MIKKFSNHPSFHSCERGGFFVVEAIVSVSALVVGFLGIVTLLSNSLALNRVVSDSYTGNYLALEGIEIVKNLIDANAIQKSGWNCGFINGGDFEIEYNSLPATGGCPGTALEPNSSRLLGFDPGVGLYGYSGSQGTGFRREIKINILSDNETQVNSIVSWTTRGGGTSSVNLEDHFWDWKQRKQQ